MPPVMKDMLTFGCSLSQSGAPASLLSQFCLCLLQPGNVPGSRGCDGQQRALIPHSRCSASMMRNQAKLVRRAPLLTSKTSADLIREALAFIRSSS